MKQILLVMIGFSLLNAQLIRTGEIVYDSQTSLHWQDNGDAKSTKVAWLDAISHCEALSLQGFTDWRLPNKNELLSIVDYSVHDPSINDVFQNMTSYYYWSSTTHAYYTGYAWSVYFYAGLSYYYSKTNTYGVRCVRGGQ